MSGDRHRKILRALRDGGLLNPGEHPKVYPVTGGVSSLVLRVDLASGSVCVKQALSRLKVATKWIAPVERSLSETAWIRTVAALDARLVPRILAEVPVSHLFVMDYLDPETHPCWKPLLAQNAVGTDFAIAVGDALARIHAHTAHSPAAEREFAHSDLFHALRVDPYLLHTADAHPDKAAAICAIADELGRARIALMHGDVSPKNILKGPNGPIFLDAECASYGDPAFDLAFCLNHLLLKTVWHPEFVVSYMAAFQALRNAYFVRVDWEDRALLDRRVARLLAVLLLARVDGKSPVEYIVDEKKKSFVRVGASALLDETDLDISRLVSYWGRRTALL